LPYIKTKFIEALELATAAEVESCIGKPAIDGPPGIHLGDSLSLTDGVSAGFVDLDGHFLAVFADAAPYHAGLRLLADEGQPRGMYRLDDIGLLDINAPNNAFLLANDNSDLLARSSARGLALVSEYDSKTFAGAIFGLALRNAGGKVTDYFPLSTFRASRP
jgi:hypothetical protein